jgi:murein DD-endopeptidase MepM/ murein hydrolase activator NlpD
VSGPGVAAPALAGIGARAARLVALAALGLLLLVLLAVLAVVASEHERRNGGVQESPGSGIPPVYLPVYAAAEHAYGVNRWLLASIHLQESDFSRLRATALSGDAVSTGWNACGAAGPMQMGIVGVAPYFATTAGGCSAGPTWAAHRRAFARAADERPVSYPQRRQALGACVRVPARDGCVYDDFDAILGAAHKLHADGATRNLDAPGTRRAVCAYVGSCLAADSYYGVLPRAKAWEAAALAARPLPTGGGVGAAGLVWPLAGPVVSPYGMRWGAMHEGIDIAAPTGTPILAAQAGQVVLRQSFGGYGQFTCLRHAVELATCYGHQSRARVRLGARVVRGQRIGRVGCSGHCFGPHLHFEVHLAGTWSAHERDVDPETFLPRR